MSLDVRLYTEVDGNEVTLFDANITHNLNKMAKEAGIYEYLWRPDEIRVTKAKELIEPLEYGLGRMKDDPKTFERLNSPNGWGLYKNFVPWIEKYLDACKKFPSSKISISR